MTITPLGAAGLTAAILLLVISQSKWAPNPEPTWLSKWIVTGITAITLVLTFTHVAAYPAALPLPLWGIGAILFAVAMASPLLGLLEKRLKSPRLAYSSDRTRNHIVNNILGAGIATATIALARRFPGTSADSLRFSNDEVFNVFLPLCTMVVLYFVYGQQEHPSPSQSAVVPESVVSQKKYENSLLRWHQLANVFHLIVMTLVATSSFLYVLAVSMLHSRAGQPLPFTWEPAVTVSLAIVFVLACGLPGARASRSVYLTFLTGTPAILCVSILWTSFFAESIARNAFAFIATTLAYAAYVTLVVLDLRERGEQPKAHFFTALAFALLLALLMVGIYFS